MPDRGCRLYPSCLACPMDRCYYEDRTAALRHRRRRMARLRRQGRTNREIAVAFGVCVRTVQRALNSAAGGTAANNPREGAAGTTAPCNPWGAGGVPGRGDRPVAPTRCAVDSHACGPDL